MLHHIQTGIESHKWSRKYFKYFCDIITAPMSNIMYIRAVATILYNDIIPYFPGSPLNSCAKPNNKDANFLPLSTPANLAWWNPLIQTVNYNMKHGIFPRVLFNLFSIWFGLLVSLLLDRLEVHVIYVSMCVIAGHCSQSASYLHWPEE